MVAAVINSRNEAFQATLFFLKSIATNNCYDCTKVNNELMFTLHRSFERIIV